MSKGETLDFRTPAVFEPLWQPARFKGAWGGRGSGKSWNFAAMMVADSIRQPGLRSVCIREVQKSLRDSAKLLIEDKIKALGLEGEFASTEGMIRTPGGGQIIFQGMQDHTADSIKSLENFGRAWIEEAHTLSARSWEILRPTIRMDGSEIWASWNPRHPTDPVDKFFRGEDAPAEAIVVKANYSDNRHFPRALEMERELDERTNRDRYAHIWLGDYEPQIFGALWTRQDIANWRQPDAPELGRIVVGVDPAASSEPGADEHGIIVAGRSPDGRNGFVLEDATMRGQPADWGRRVVSAFDAWEADAIVVEVNNGGDMCKHVLATVRPGLPIITVHATRGKHVRAEPIAALYQNGRVRHIGTFDKLEDQMVSMTAAGYEGEGSPDRLDAMVWAMTELFPTMVKRAPKKTAPRREFVSQGWMG